MAEEAGDRRWTESEKTLFHDVEMVEEVGSRRGKKRISHCSIFFSAEYVHFAFTAERGKGWASSSSSEPATRRRVRRDDQGREKSNAVRICEVEECDKMKM